MSIIKKLYGIVPHAVIVLSLVFFTFIVLDWYNPLMGFLSTPSSTVLLIALCVLSSLSSVICIVSRMPKPEVRQSHGHTHRR